MTYQALIFDLDGTAIPSVANGMPTEKVVRAVQDAKPYLKLCAATGRSVSNSRAILERLKLTDPCIISAGTQIVDPNTWNILWEVMLHKSDIQSVIDVCSRYPYECLVGNQLLGEGKPAANLEVSEANVIYIMECSQADGDAIVQELSRIPTITAVGMKSWLSGGVDVHITHHQATKEHAVNELLKLIGVQKEHTVGVGDGNNDLHLFNSVGHRVAMGNATPELKAAANEVIADVEHDGLADLLYELVDQTQGNNPQS